MTKRSDPGLRARTARWLVGLGLALAIAGCGGGGDSQVPDPGVGTEPEVPAAVTASIAAATGGSVDVALAEGASATLVFPANAFASDQSVTITPLAASAGDWTRFSLVPGLADMQAPLTLRVRPPASVAAADLPVLQLVTDDGPLVLRTTLLPDGRLEAVLSPLLGAPETGIASVGRAKAAAAARPQAAGGGGSTVAGTGFVSFCTVPEATVADARRVILNASRVSQVNSALGMLAMLRERCTGAAAALAAFVTEIPVLHAQALSDWQAVNYLEVETQVDTFRRGVRRVIALCAAGQLLGSALNCPLAADFDGQYAEIADGFAAAAAEREDSGSLRVLFEPLLSLPSEAELLNLPQAAPALRDTLAVIADRLMDRAYVLCNGAELFEWRSYVESGGPSRRSGETLRRGMGYCGLELSAAFGGTSAKFVPGSLDGAGRVVERTLLGPFDGEVLATPKGSTTHCSRVIGTPASAEPLIVRVGSTTIEEIPAFGGAYDGALLGKSKLPDLLAALGRPADSTDPIRLDFYRGAVNLSGCTDSRGNPLVIQAPEVLLYSLNLTQVQPLDVSLTLPAAMNQATTITVRARDSVTNTPAVGATVIVTVTGGSVSNNGVTNVDGQFSTTVTPAFGVNALTVFAEVRAVNGALGRASGIVQVNLSRSFGGVISMTHTFFNRIGDSTTTDRFEASRSIELTFAEDEESKSFTITAQGGSATHEQVSLSGECESIVTKLQGPVVRDTTFEIKPTLALGSDGGYRITFGSVFASESGTKFVSCGGINSQFVIPPQRVGSGNNAEPDERFVIEPNGTLQGTSTRVVRTGTPDGTVVTESTRTVTWSIAPR